MNRHVHLDMTMDDLLWVAENLIPEPKAWHTGVEETYRNLKNIDSVFVFILTELFELEHYEEVDNDLACIFHSILIAYLVVHFEQLKQQIEFSKTNKLDYQFKLPLWIKSVSSENDPNVYFISKLDVVKTFDSSTHLIRTSISELFLDRFLG